MELLRKASALIGLVRQDFIRRVRIRAFAVLGLGFGIKLGFGLE
jgi:hypothetical protein